MANKELEDAVIGDFIPVEAIEVRLGVYHTRQCCCGQY